MTSFSRYISVKKLKEKKPLDLTNTAILTKERVLKMSEKSGEMNFLYGTERVDEEILKLLFELAEEASVLEKMKKMQSGEEINFIQGCPSEQRAVLHTAMRDFFEEPIKEKNAKQASDLAKKECDKLKKILPQIEKFTDVIQIGIGGSELGPKALASALKPFWRHGKNVHFISNVDPDHAASVLKKVDLSSTLVICVSKSGKTMETFCNEEFLRQAFVKKGINPKDHMIAVTGVKSPMDDSSKYFSSFYIWDYVGGRYSATSMVGGVVLGFLLGFENFLKILEGASKMDKIALSKGKKNLPLLGALFSVWNHTILHESTEVILPYSQALRDLVFHLQQCDMESNGKSVDQEGNVVDFNTGPILFGDVGTNGQHSFYQLLHQGTERIFLEFIGVKNSQYGEDVLIGDTTSQEKLLSNLFAQAIAFAMGQKSSHANRFFPGNRPSHILLLDRIDPYHMGLLLAYYEHKIAFEGFIWGINSFDQEGVQLGKVLADKMVDLFRIKREKKGKVEFPLGEAYLEILERS